LVENSVILGDTMGELRAFYSLANVVFVGRSLVPMGGSDPMEAAGLGKPIIIGSYFDNFQQPVQALRAGGALAVVETPAALIAMMRKWLADPDELERRGRLGQGIVITNQGATQKTVTRLVAILRRMAQPVATFSRADSSLGSELPEHYNSLSPAAREKI
jgi:3-deoxy-D-manno-octulosonic-acid transferase